MQSRLGVRHEGGRKGRKGGRCQSNRAPRCEAAAAVALAAAAAPPRGGASDSTRQRERHREHILSLTIVLLSALLLLSALFSGSVARDEGAYAAAEPPCAPPYTSDAAVAPSLPLCAAAAPSPALPSAPLVHAPDLHTLRKPAYVALDVRRCAAPPAYAVVVSVHDAAHVLRRNLRALFDHTAGQWELIVVLDACSDGSQAEATDALRELFGSGNATAAAAARGLARARLVVQPNAVWETSSDNIGMRLAHPGAQWLLLVQADILVTERGWNARLALPASLWADVWAVSGRAAHNAAASRFENSPGFNMTPGRDLDVPPSAAQLAAAARTFYIRDALNRGPVALRADVARELGFLNERDFHLGRDEHDLMMRAYLHRGLKCGKYDVGFAMPKRDGASRRKGRKAGRSGRDWLYLSYRLLRKRRAAAHAPALALDAVPQWNEERRVEDAQLAAALAAAEAQTCM